MRLALFGRAFALGCAALLSAAPTASATPHLTVLTSFGGGGNPCVNPNAGVLRSPDGSLYGTALGGSPGCQGYAVFALTPSASGYRFHKLWSSQNLGPQGPLVMDRYGSLYSTAFGGRGNSYGFIQKLKENSEGRYRSSDVHDFTAQDGDQANPPFMDERGRIYGTTASLGAHFAGSFYELTPTDASLDAYKETARFAFGATTIAPVNPIGFLSRDASGTFYGAAQFGGFYHSGVVFSLKRGPAGFVLSLLYNFDERHKGRGFNPVTGVVMDQRGHLFGQTAFGGNGACRHGCGVVYELIPAAGGYTERVLYDLPQFDQSEPVPYAVTLGSGGDVLGFDGGAPTGDPFRIFDLRAPQYVPHIVPLFDGTVAPNAQLLRVGVGTFIGTTFSGGAYGKGTVFQLDL